MNHIDTFADLPAHVRRDLAPFVDGMRANIDVVRRYFNAHRGADPFLVESSGGRTESDQVYEDDGNTPAKGTAYRFAWFHHMEAVDPSNLFGYSDYYNSRFERCVVHAVEVTYRDRDKSRRRCYHGIHVGFGGGRKPERIDYSTHSVDCKLAIAGLCDLIDRVKQVDDRIQFEKAVQHIVDAR